MNHRFTTWSLALTCLLAVLIAPAYAQAETKRYALIVANNGSLDEGVESLRYADDDGARFYELFDSYADDVALLTTLDADSQKVFPNVAPITSAPTRANLGDQVTRLKARLAADKKNGVRTELFLVFTGHGNVDESGEGYLSLADSRLKRSDLYREVIRPLDADYTNLIIDACHAYFMVRSRGGNGWQDDRSGQSFDAEFQAYLKSKQPQRGNSTIGVILSTAGAAEVHEWSRFRSGVFSHQLRSGLLGAADADGDGDVTYPEIEAYLVAANSAVTNPKAKIHVFVEGPKQDRARSITNVDRYKNATQLEIPKGDGGRMYLEDARGLRYADMHLDPSVATRVALLRKPVSSRPYYLRQGDKQATIPVEPAKISTQALAYLPRADQSRGSVEEAFRSDLFSTPFGPSFVAGYSAGRENSQVRVESFAPVAQSSWSLEFSPELTFSTASLAEVDAVQYNLALSLESRHDSGWGVGPYLEYGFTPDSSLDLHRISVGAQGSYQFLTGPFESEFRIRFGHQTLLADADQLRSDPLGLRTEAAIVVRWADWDGIKPHLVGGVALDITSRADLEESTQSVTPAPFAGLGLRF